MTKRHARNLGEPDEVNRFPGVTESLVQVGEWTVGRVVQAAGWRWSVDMQPIVGGDWCPSRHVGVLLAGRQGALLDDGTVLEFGPGDVYEIPPRHDGYTIGDEDAVMIEWAGLQVWAGRAGRFADRVLVTLVLTDVVGSTAALSRAGDAAWRERLGRHYETARLELERYRGREVNTTGDGLLATFDGPARAIACAEAIREGAIRDGLHVRAGVHTGEVERVGADVRGVGVHKVARIAALAAADEILVSSTSADLATGAGLRFEDRGEHALKGLEGRHRLLAVID
ncbi:MAG: adenylate/guanylate cyclase domain-containing protein [Candidatus Limnocylindrales bacterium]